MSALRQGMALRTVAWLSAVLLIGFAIGMIVGHVWLALTVTLAGYLAVQMWRLLRFERWLSRRRREPPPDYEGVWGEVIAIVSRIDRRKQFHKARVVRLLREFRRLTAAMPDGAILLGADNDILWFNARAAEWLRLRRKRDFGMRVENLVRHPEFVDYLQRDDPHLGVVINEPSNPELWLSFHRVKSSATGQQLLIIRDVSQQARLEAMRRDFVANASHELRSPLTVIAGYLDSLAEDDQLELVWQAPLEEMRRQAERMSTIINSLLELSKLESEHGSLQEQRPIDIGGILAMLRKEVLTIKHRAQNIEIKNESDAWLLGAESEIHSAISNLVLNAVKYTPPEGMIELRWWTDTSGGHLAVRDTGIGFAPEHIPRLTERFYRVDSGRSRELGGSGLGLAIVKHVLQRHGATLSIESVEGLGSVFTCHFPPERVVMRPK